MKMNGMEHDMLMPGMLTDEEMAALDKARGPEFDRLFLTGMIRHHQGAIDMVDVLFKSYGAAQDETVFKFASDVYADQSIEIDRMHEMLESPQNEINDRSSIGSLLGALLVAAAAFGAARVRELVERRAPRAAAAPAPPAALRRRRPRRRRRRPRRRRATPAAAPRLPPRRPRRAAARRGRRRRRLAAAHRRRHRRRRPR